MAVLIDPAGPDYSDYASLGFWAIEADDPTASPYLQMPYAGTDWFVYGLPTPLADMPTTGVGYYYGTGTAIESRDGLRKAGHVIVEAGADFERQTIQTSIKVARLDDLFPVTLRSDAMAIAGNGFAGPLAGQGEGADYAGSVEGGFFGPGAVEIGGAFEADGPTRIRGAFIGTRDFDRLVD